MKKFLLILFALLCFLVFNCETDLVGASCRTLTDFLSFPAEQPYRTAYHFQPPSNWMNDPNGPMYYNGVYHLFYQYNPYAATFGDVIIWAHSVSYDLINWIHLDPALYPTHESDINSCWSGSATILPGNKPVILYTGKDSRHREVQNLAMPKNLSDPFLREWVKYSRNPLMMPPEGVKDDCFRDPTTAWVGPDGVWRTVVGGDRNNNGMAFLYQSKDFLNWVRHEQPLAAAEATGTWECPDFFPVPVNGTNGLDTSEMGTRSVHVMKAGFKMRDWYTIGRYSPERENFLPQNELNLTGNYLNLRYDYGNFYASKSFYDEAKKRRVLWGWVLECDSKEDDIQKGWAGLQSFPRAVWLDESGKQLVLWPIEEIKTLRVNEEVKLVNKKLKSRSLRQIHGITASQVDVTISFKIENLEEAEKLDPSLSDPQVLCTKRDASSNGAFGPFGLLVMASKDLQEQTAIFFRVFQDQNEKYVVLMCSDQSRSSVRNSINKTSFGTFVDIDPRHQEISLRSLIDHSIIESFGAEGKTVITSRVYPKFAIDKNAHLFAFNNGTQRVIISKMSAWSMKNAQFSVDQTLKSVT